MDIDRSNGMNMKSFKTLIAMILAVTLCMTSVFPVLAAEDADAGAAEMAAEKTESEQIDEEAEELIEEEAEELIEAEDTERSGEERSGEEQPSEEQSSEEQEAVAESESEAMDDSDHTAYSDAEEKDEPENSGDASDQYNSDHESEEYVQEEIEADDAQDPSMVSAGVAQDPSTESTGVAQAILTEDNRFTFYYGPLVAIGDTFQDQRVNYVFSGDEVTDSGDDYPDRPLWYSSFSDGTHSYGPIGDYVTSVVFDSSFKAVKPSSAYCWFSGCYKLTEIDLTGLDTSNIKNMCGMFENCSSLTSIDVSGFDTTKVTDMRYMFGDCSGLTSIDISSFETSNVKYMSGMFLRCSSLTSIDFTGLDASAVTDMRYMFNSCSNLESVDLSTFDLKKTDSAGTYLYSMFGDCSSLEKIYCSDNAIDWSWTVGTDMFRGCTSLTGISDGSTVNYDSAKIDSAMAKTADLGGYFTPKGTSIPVDKGKCGDHITWTLDEEGTLTLSGSGPMYDYDVETPWYDYNHLLKKIIINKGITSIGKRAFTASNAITVDLADSVTSIGENAFASTELENVWIPENVKTIGDHAFYSCNKLKFVTFGKNVQLIDSKSFGACGNLAAVFFLGIPETIAEDTFYGCGSFRANYSPSASADWNENNKRKYGASNITWGAWTPFSCDFEEKEYTVSTGKTKSIYVVFASDTIPVYDYHVECASDDLLEFSSEKSMDYEGLVWIKLTGKKAGKTEISVSLYTAISREPIITTTSITVTDNPDGESGIEEISNLIPYSIHNTYSFHNLSSSIPELGAQFYLKFFSPAQAGIIARSNNGRGGHCFGMVNTAIATAFYNSPAISSYGGKSVLDEITADSESSVTKLSASEYIKYAQVYSSTVQSQKRLRQTMNTKLEGLYKTVVDYVKGYSAPVDIYVYDNDTGAHELLARGIGENNDDYTEIVVYDCNYEGSEDCKIVLHKKLGKYTSWEYKYRSTEYLSENSGMIGWRSETADFIEAFNSDSYKNTGGFDHLITVSSNGSAIKTSSGKTIILTPDHVDDLDTLVPITVSGADPASEASNMYWLDLGEEYTVEAPGTACSYEIASPNSGAAFTLPANSEAQVRVADNEPNSIAITAQSALQYAITFTDTNSAGTGVDSCEVSGDSNGGVTVSQADEGIVVSGEGISTVTIKKEDKTDTVTVPKDTEILLIEEDGTAVYEGLKDLSLHSTITLSGEVFAYTGKEITPDITVKDIEGKTLERGTDYQLLFENNTIPGEGKVTIEGLGSYTGEVVKNFKILPIDQTISVKAKASTVAVGKTTTITTTGAKGSVAYKSSNESVATVSSTGKVTAKKVGTVKITVTAKATEQYKEATKTVAVKVVPAATTSITAANLATGIKLTWKKVAGASGYIVYRNGTKVATISKGTTVTYTDKKANTNGTKYTFKIVAKASTGTSTLSKSLATYRVARPAISSLKNSASKKMTVKWGKNTKASGYLIQYSLKSSFASPKTVTIGKNSVVSKVIVSLTKGKKYYVRIRSFKTVSGKKYYSAWSAAKAVTIKK